ncbi:MAG: hypothetical protein JXA33_29730 [Anaerolineae bacterium]|nr:hypothetical protein [Anaerolineae bacterium]
MAVDMELESILRPPELSMVPYPPKVITLANGKKMVVREVTRRDVPKLLKAVHPTMFIDKDYYNVVGARVYAELIAWQYYRVQNEFCIIGQVEGILVGLVNSRLYTKETGMSLHTLAIDRGLRIGAHLFAAKMEHHIEFLEQDDVLIVAESPIGFRRWMTEYGLEPTGIPHELGGAPAYRLTRELYFNAKSRLVVGDRPVSDALLEEAKQDIIVADEKMIREKIAGLKGR